MKILKLTAENIKKLKVVEIEPHGNVVQVTGKNGSGKSSTLDAIWWALAGGDAIQGKPIREGEETARIKLDLGDLVVERKFTAKGTTLVVQNAEGAKYGSPQKMLDALVGSLSFDPLEFSRLQAKEQFNLLRQFVSSVDFDAIDAANKADYETRTQVNREQKAAQVEADGIALPQGLPDEAPNETELVEKLKNAADTNSEINARQQRRESAAARVLELEKKISDLKAILEAAEKEKNDTSEALAKAEPLPPLVDTAEVQKQIEAARVTQGWIAKRTRKAELMKRAKEKESESETITKRMTERSESVKAAIAAADLPLPGLGLGDGIVTMNGIPFDQLSSAEQLRASVAIAMASNPKLRVIRIKDGSLLDDNGLEIIKEAATNKDFQIWIESVNSSGKVGIYMEDGEVVAINP